MITSRKQTLNDFRLIKKNYGSYTVYLDCWHMYFRKTK